MKRKFVSIGLVTLVVLIGWYAGAFRPGQSKLGELNDDVEAAKQQVSTLQAKLQTLISLKQNEPKIRAEVERMSTALPNVEPKVSDFIIQVQDAANAAGIDFLTITPSLPAVPENFDVAPAAQSAPAATPAPSVNESKPGTTTTAPAKPQTPVRSISVQIKAEGRFFEIEQFVVNMEHLARALRIDSFDLSAGGGDTAGVLSASMKLQIFMLVPQAAAGGSSTQTTQGT